MNRLFRTALLLGFLFLLLALLPGDLSLLGLLKSLADRAVADGDFEALTLDFYNRLRIIFGIVAFGLIITSSGALLTGKQPRLTLGFTVGFFLFFALSLLAFINLATRRLNSQVYRYLSGTPIAYGTAVPTPSPTQTTGPPPTPTEVIVEPGQWELVVSGVEQPIMLTEPDDGTGRLFVGSKLGLIQIIQNGQLLSTPFLDIRDRVIQQVENPEQGFLGFAFHPNYAQNGYFYVYYNDYLGDIHLSRFQVSATDPNQAAPASEKTLLFLVDPEPIHNAGHLAFGPDGYLYVAVGDGGIRLDPGEYAQSLDTLFGKILRLDVDNGELYAIPSDNPFAGRGVGDEIWAYGLRNPWRFSFDALTGDLYVGDVGHDAWEEINFIPSDSSGGVNFGWNHYEGTRLYTQYSNPPPAPLDNHTPPIWEYRNHQDGRCAIVGGYVYRGEAIPALQGTYLYSDYCTGVIWGLRQSSPGVWENETLFDTQFAISSFAEDLAHNLYLLDLVGNVYRLAPK
ncbi:MAG: hypothetical protein Fur0022_36610 [Anaerolineales bacterium]